jgi:hypothetical protein
VVRYLGLPTPDDNLAGYQASDVTAKAKKLDGKKFLIVHGTAGMSQAPAGAEKKHKYNQCRRWWFFLKN